MSAIRLPLLYAFAGGCLSNLVLFGIWRATDGFGASSAQDQHRSHNVVQLVTAVSAAPSVEQPSELVAAKAADRGHDLAPDPAPTQAAQDVDGAGRAPTGSAVSDVLMGLEAAYRERVAARAPAQAASTPEGATAAAPTDNPIAAAEPAASAVSQLVAEGTPVVPAVTAAAIEARAVVPAAVSPQVALAAVPPQVAPAAVPPQVAAVPAFEAPQDAPPPTEIHDGDVNQNTYITNVRQGDVYLIQMQQLAMLQYAQLLNMSSGAAPSARRAGRAFSQRFPSGITNPDNPWGFHFAPPNLVR